MNVHSGQRVITSNGAVAIIAFVRPDGVAMAWGKEGYPVPVRVVADAWGGEHDLTHPGPALPH